jgi:hypothetical protein
MGDGINLGQEAVTTGQLLLGGTLEVGKARLHGGQTHCAGGAIVSNRVPAGNQGVFGINSVFLDVLLNNWRQVFFKFLLG